jgi:hypothetical protein
VQKPVSGLRIWSLSEIMRHYNVWQLANALAFLTQMQIDAEERLRVDGDSSVSAERMNNYYVPLLKLVSAECERLELTAALYRLAPFNQEIRQGISWSELRNQSKTMLEAIHSELCYRRFAFVQTPKATMHDRFGHTWEPIWSVIADAKEDSQRAIDCYALEQDTACVFHLMRVAEFGLRFLAKKLRVRITHKGKKCPIEYGDWEKVITEIKNKITQARQSASVPKRQARLELYSDAADHCTFMKDIWRNNVSHARKPYNDSEALAVFDRVRDFMRFLADKMGAKP